VSVKHNLEQGKPLGLFAPHPLLSAAFSDVNTVFIYRQEKFLNWFCDDESICNSSIAWDSRLGSRLQFAIEKLRTSEPIFARHFQNLMDLEKTYREIALSILSLSNDLENKEISSMVFPSMSSHHIDSLMMEIACQLNDIPQVFQYIPVIENRCIPVVQNHGVADRRILSITHPSKEVSHFRTIESTTIWKAPIIGNTLRRSSSFHRSALKLTMYQFRTSVRRFRLSAWSLLPRVFFPVKNRYLRYEFNSEAKKSSLRNITLWQDLRLMKEHQRSLGLLNELIASDAKTVVEMFRDKTSSSETLIAIAANFQPEATSFPEAGKIYNYVDLVISMRGQGIRGPILYKEHPATQYFTIGNRSTRCGVSRSRSFYSSLKELGVLFLNSEFDLCSSTAVVPLTFNGSIAIERSLRGLPTIVTGHPWFAGLPGTYSLEQFPRHYHDANLENQR